MTVAKSRRRRLRNTYKAMKKLADRCSWVDTDRGSRPRFEFVHNGNIEAEEYPDMYGVTLRVKGIESLAPFRERYEHSCTIYLPETYPTEAPIVKWHTPIFHPNILTFDENNELYQELCGTFGSEELLTEHFNKDPRWAELLDGYVCLDTLRENWTPFVGLDALVIEIANVVRYQTYSANNPFNRAAARWAKEQEKLRGYFPLDDGLLEIEVTAGVQVVNVDSGA